MKVLVTGGQGQLARAIQAFWTGHQVILPAEETLDLGDPAAVDRVIEAQRPQVVINAGAFTQVDLCESDPAKAMRINGHAVGWLARACGGIGALLVQISTDYVFDGQAVEPYAEEHPARPLSVYGQSKLLGEQEALGAPDHLIVRTAWLYDAWGKNFLRTMLDMAAQGRALKVVDDQRGAPTSCRALARQLQAAVEAGCRGTLHATCSGETTWHGFAAEIFRQGGIRADLAPCSTLDFPRPAQRPAYSVLSGARRRSLGVDVMPGWEEALAEVTAHLRGTHE